MRIPNNRNETIMSMKRRLSQTKQMLDFPETTLGEGLKVIYHWYCHELLLKAEYKLEGRRIKHGKWMNHMNETLIFRHELHENL